MKVLKIIAVCIAFIPLVDGCKKDSPTKSNDGQAKTINDFLVKDEISGWSYSGSGWTANNISELTSYIDGEAPIYERHGFVEAASQNYQGTVNSQTRTITLIVFNQGSLANAAELYVDPSIVPGAAVNWSGGVGDSARYVRYVSSQTLQFRRQNYYVRIGINTNSDESLNIIQQFASNIDGKITN